MAKRKQRKPVEKIRLETRLDADIVDGLRWLADGAGVSVNQVVNGILRWASDHAHAGEPVTTGSHVVEGDGQAGVVWFGDLLDPDDPDNEPGRVVFVLDFTERRVVREEW